MDSTSITLAAALNNDILYEVVDGHVVEPPPLYVDGVLVASALVQKLCELRDQGRAIREALFDFTKSIGNMRRPDVAFISFDRWPRDKQVPRTEAWDVVPNLAVEVISPKNMADGVIDKVAEYFLVGIERVWVIYPSQRQVYVYASPTDVRVVAENEELTDDALLHGFRLSLSALFDDTAAAK